MTTVVENIVESFLHPAVFPIVRIPTYNTLMDSIYQISYNAASMQTTLCGGNIGSLMLTISLTVYATLSTTHFKVPQLRSSTYNPD